MTRPAFASACAALALAVVPASARDVSFTLSSGLSRPNQARVREIYRSGVPLSAIVRARVRGRVGLLAGAESWPSTGTVPPSSGPAGGYDVRLALRTVPVGAWIRFPAGPVSVDAACGAVRFRFEESWPAASLRVRGRRWGWFGALAADLPVSGSLAFSAVLRFDGLPTGAGAGPGKVDLGGVRVLAGLTVSPF